MHCSDLLKYSNFSSRALEESPIPVFLVASLSAVHLSLLSLMQWLITAHFKHGYSPLISSHTLPILLSPIAALIMWHLLSSSPHSSCIHKRKLPPSITTRTFSKSALKSLCPIKMVRFHYRLHAMKNRLSRIRQSLFLLCYEKLYIHP